MKALPWLTAMIVSHGVDILYAMGRGVVLAGAIYLTILIVNWYRDRDEKRHIGEKERSIIAEKDARIRELTAERDRWRAVAGERLAAIRSANAAMNHAANQLRGMVDTDGEPCYHITMTLVPSLTVWISSEKPCGFPGIVQRGEVQTLRNRTNWGASRLLSFHPTLQNRRHGQERQRRGYNCVERSSGRYARRLEPAACTTINVRNQATMGHAPAVCNGAESNWEKTPRR